MAQHECKISVCCCLPPFELFLFRDMTIAGALVTAHIMLRCAVDSQLCLQFTFAKFINDVKYVHRFEWCVLASFSATLVSSRFPLFSIKHISWDNFFFGDGEAAPFLHNYTSSRRTCSALHRKHRLSNQQKKKHLLSPLLHRFFSDVFPLPPHNWIQKVNLNKW